MDTITLCRVDALGLWTGDVITQDVFDPCPQGWVPVAAPKPTKAKPYAIWDGQGAFVLTAAAPAPSVEDARAALTAAVVVRRDALIRQGAIAGNGLHVALDDGSRADLGGMATTALGALSGALPWPDSYAQGWISTENTRIPLETPQDGLALAALAGTRYAAVVQAARTLKDQIGSAADQAALDAIDITAGWPA